MGDSESEFLKKSIEQISKKKGSTLKKQDSVGLKSNATIIEAVEEFIRAPKEIIPVLTNNEVIGTIKKLNLVSAISLENKSHLEKSDIKQILDKNVCACSTKMTLNEIYQTLINCDTDAVILIKDNKLHSLLDCFDLGKIILNTNFEIENPPAVKEAMTEKFTTIDLLSNLLDLKKTLVENSSNFAIVMNKNSPVGIVTLKDLICQIPKYINPENCLVESIMSANIKSIHPGTPITEVLDLLVRRKFNQIPLVAENKILGIAKIKDIIKTYYEFIASIADPKSEYVITKTN